MDEVVWSGEFCKKDSLSGANPAVTFDRYAALARLRNARSELLRKGGASPPPPSPRLLLASLSLSVLRRSVGCSINLD
jgi:hypothetical protein